MKKKYMVIVGIVSVALIAAIAYFTIVHPYVKMYMQIQHCYQEFNVDGLGMPASSFTEYSVTDDRFVMVETPDYNISLPAYFTDQTKDGADIMVYSANSGADTQSESAAFGKEGTDSADMAILNQENLTESDKRRLMDGYERLGYGIPDTCYSSLKCAYLITEDDYSFTNRNQSRAYTLLVPYRTGAAFFYSDGIHTTYIYETDKMYAFISEFYNTDWGLYIYHVDFYNPKDLNTSYVAILKTKTPQTAYAIMNSIEFKE